MNQVAVIIVNWNTGKLLARCITSLRALPEQELLSRVVIIDNASTDDSMVQAQAAAASDKKYICIQAKQNLGFAKANNMGIAKLGEQSSTHILLLNPDTEMKSGSLRALLNALEGNSKTGVIGPKLLNPNGTLQPSVRRFPTFASQAILFLKLHWLLPSLSAWQTYMAADFNYNKEQAVDQIMGACFLIRREAWKNIGALDERFWVWFEEVDFCKRAKQNGWHVIYTPTAEVIHHGGASFHQRIGWRKSMPLITSSLVYASKHFSLPAVIGLYALAPISLLLALPASLVHVAQRKQRARAL